MTIEDQPFPDGTPDGFRDISLPAKYQGHPLLNGPPFFTLPEELIVKFVGHVGESRVDSELLKMEFELSRIHGEHCANVGFWGGCPITFELLRSSNSLAGDDVLQWMQECGYTEKEALETTELAGDRLSWTRNVRRGYCGWLMTNRTFLSEHDAIFSQWAGLMEQNGIPVMGAVVRDAQAIPGSELASAEMEPFIQAFQDFFIRWRLDSMPAPFTPVPMSVHLPVSDLRTMLGHMRDGGMSFYFPDIFPIPGRETIREMIEEALRDSQSPEHLLEWFSIVRSENRAKNEIVKYNRLFEVQHYLRAIYSRHGKALRRKKSSIKIALSEFLRVSEDTIERNLAIITKNLGKNWLSSLANDS
jgi:hypothetical protein